MSEDLDAQDFPDATKRVTHRWDTSMAEQPAATATTYSALYRATMLKTRETLQKYSESTQSASTYLTRGQTRLLISTSE